MRAVDLFCGCGGMSLGFQKAGFEIAAAYDVCDAAVAIYRRNFAHPAFVKNLLDEDAPALVAEHRPDIVVGGPPCQDFSISGKRNFTGRRANLTLRFAEIVSEVRPEWFVMENVYNIEKSPVLPEAAGMLRGAGYGLTKRILDASYCWVPQARRRFFLIGRLGAQDGFLAAEIACRMSQKRMTVRDWLGDSLKTEFYYMHPRNYARRAVFSIDEPSATIRGINRPIPANYRRHPADKADIADGVRCLSTKERSYIQTFPESFVFEGPKTDVELAIGNAVPVNLAKFVGACIMAHCRRTQESADGKAGGSLWP